MGLFRSLFGRRARDTRGKPEEAAIREAIERLVEETDPRIRLVRRYPEKLRPGVEAALHHSRDIIASIPGPAQ